MPPSKKHNGLTNIVSFYFDKEKFFLYSLQSNFIADVAQLVEQWFCKPLVGGSSPLVGFIKK